MYTIEFYPQAKSDIEKHQKFGNKIVLKKIVTFLEELTSHPFSGTGKPEALKHDFNGLWSRRIDKEHRFVYEVIESKVYVHSAYGHYN